MPHRELGKKIRTLRRNDSLTQYSVDPEKSHLKVKNVFWNYINNHLMPTPW